MDKMQEKITVGQLKKGDVIGTKSGRSWEWGATVGEVSERPGHYRLRVKDTNGFDLGGTINHKRDAEVWVERDASPIMFECPHCGGAVRWQPQEVDHVLNLLRTTQVYAPSQEAKDHVELIVTQLREGMVNDETIVKMIVGWLNDGLRWGNWPWNLTEQEKQIRP